jgi:hypothetical protein
MRKLVQELFGPRRVLSATPAGISGIDRGSNFGIDALRHAANIYSLTRADVTTEGTETALTALQVIRGLVFLAAGASGAFVLRLPSTVSIFSLLAPSIQTDGLFGWPLTIVNVAVGQTGTLTAASGDSSQTVSGTATFLTNTVRDFYCQVTAPGTLVIVNCGSKSL